MRIWKIHIMENRSCCEKLYCTQVFLIKSRSLDALQAHEGRGLVMTLRTPRRRISPRTKRRCRVIRNFFRRALGSSSQPEIKISSSIAVNVTDLKHKIIGLEHQLNEVSQHCQDLACLESLSKNSSSLGPEQNKTNPESNRHPEPPSNRHSKEELTKVLYKTSESHYKQSDESDYGAKFRNVCDRSQANVMNTLSCDAAGSKPKKKKSKLYSELNDYDQNLSKRRTKSVYENFGSFYSTSSYHSVTDPKMAHVHKGDCNERHNRCHRRDYVEIEPFHLKDKKIKDHVRDTYKEEKRIRSRKIKHNRELDQEFIADIIRRQYKPVKMFGRRESDISQFSAPVCRDQEYLIPEDTRDTELCSCCYESRRTKPKRHKDLTDMRSICDTRLYSSKRPPRYKHHRRLVEAYNDSELYDLVPVKEKSSPKSRRKFVEDNVMAYNYYKEVPPSPRTHRPRLNLKAQYFAEFEDFLAQKRQNRRNSPLRPKRIPERNEIFETDASEMPPDFVQKQKSVYPTRTQVQKQNTGTVSSLHSPKYGNEIVPETGFNKTQETDLSLDKTDKALSEIKDILQSFLLEIKKETTASQCDKSDVTSKVNANELSNPNNSTNVKPSLFPHSGHSFNYNTSCSMPPCVPAFPNTCCYPVLPMCPMNPISCMQNGYAAPTPSFTCATCANKETAQEEKPSKSANNTTTEFCNPETEELIKEIYKYVAQSPRLKRHDTESERKEKDKLLTSRSVGGSTRGSKRDANVGTPKMKCYSKSCEAISTRLVSETYYSGTNASYSDTLLEKLSVEATPSDSVSETDFTTETSTDKGKNNKLAKVLRTFGFMKKKKKDVIEELSESESAIDVEIKPKPPFKQKITNYMMHGEEYYHPPPVPPMHHHPHPEFHEHHHHQYLPRVSEYPPHEGNHSPRMHHTPHIHSQPPYHAPPMPTAPPYSQGFDNYKQMQQNVPLCLKEIEVKSIGTQSERKMSFFRKMKTKIQTPGLSVRSDEMAIKNCSTQTAQSKPPPVQVKPGLFNWKNLQKPTPKMDPMAFSYMKQKQLAEGDFKLRDAMVKKLFYKRNPFSPRNLLVRTILGKDKSSFGDPPTMYRPRMFF